MQVSKVPINREGMETTEHGSPSFPMAVYHSVMSRNIRGHIPWHWHKEIQFCLVTVGGIRFFVNEKEYLRTAPISVWTPTRSSSPLFTAVFSKKNM